MTLNELYDLYLAHPTATGKWSTILGNGQPYSGNSIKMVNLFQDKTQPFINERFAPQTIQQYLSNIQLNKCYAEGLNGFSGKKMRIGSMA